jgi:hypothetical protein
VADSDDQLDEGAVSELPPYPALGRLEKPMSGPPSGVPWVIGGVVVTFLTIIGYFVLFALVASDPESGPGIAFGQIDGKPRVAIVLCPGSQIQRVSVFASQSERPATSTLLWGARDPKPGLRDQRVFTIGEVGGFRTEIKPLTAKLPSVVQVEWETSDGGVDAVIADKGDFYQLKAGQWFDGDGRVTLEELEAQGC